MNKKSLIIWIPVAVLLANIVVYLIVAKARAPSPPVAASATGGPAAGRLARETADDTATELEKHREEKALARKATGVAALDAGDYDRALIAFAEAQDLLGDKAHVAELLKVTEDLRKRARSAPSPSASRSAPTPPPRPASRSAMRRLAAREQPAVEVPPPTPAPPAPGLLIVTTVPRGLLVHVDEAPIDLTPMRASFKRGPHRIALLDGGKKIYETTVEVKDGAVTTLVRDLSAELSPEPARSTAQAPEPAPEPAPPAPAVHVQEEAPRPSPAAAPPPAPRAPPSASPRRPRPPTSTTGTVAVSSPGLYGVVWINGRPRGYPPLEAGDLPPGPTRIEVRVNGVERRSSTVVVRPGSTTPVKLLSLETAP